MGGGGLDVDDVEGLAGGHEEAVAVRAAEADVGADFREEDLADALGFGGEDLHAVVTGAKPEPTQMLPAVSQRMPSVRPATLL
jgi:hypothetical protein